MRFKAIASTVSRWMESVLEVGLVRSGRAVVGLCKRSEDSGIIALVVEKRARTVSSELREICVERYKQNRDSGSRIVVTPSLLWAK